MITAYLIYFLGPFLLAFALVTRGARTPSGAGRPPSTVLAPFAIGMAAFLVAWLSVMTITVVSIQLDPRIREGTFVFVLIVSAAAGLFEETSRYLAFRLVPVRARRDAPTGLRYALGHSGMESIISGER